MTFDEARQAIYSLLKTYWDANHPDIEVNWGNRERTDLLDQEDPFIGCKVIFEGGEQKSMEENPLNRYFGCIHLPVFVREHEGEALQNRLLQELADLFKTRAIGHLTTKTPMPLPGEGFKGWWRKSLRIDFWFDDR